MCIRDRLGEDGNPANPLDLTPFFGDPDVGDVVTISVDPSDLPSGLTFDPATGEISGTPDADASQGGPNGDGVYEVEVTATDPSGETFTTTVTYNITNPPPVAVDDGPLDVIEDTPTVFDLLSNDNDPDGDPLTIAEINGEAVQPGDVITLPSGAELEVNPDGTVTYIPVENSNAPDSFTYTVSDGNGGTDTAVVDINVIPVNDVPSNIGIELPPQQNLDGEDIDPVDVSGAFEDIDGDALTFTADNLPQGLTLNPNTGIISGTLDNSSSVNGPYTVTITATDPDGETVEASFIWTVENIPPAEIASLPAMDLTTAGLVSISASDAFTGGVITNPDDGLPEVLNVATASAFNDPDGDTLTFTAEGLPEGLEINPNTGEITGTASEEGVFNVIITADDGEGGQANTILTLNVLQNGFIIPDEGSSLAQTDAFTPYEWLEGEPIDLQEFFADHSIAAELFDRGADNGPSPYLGGVLVTPVNGFSSDCTAVMIEAIVHEHSVDVQLLSSLEQFCSVDVNAWNVTLANGNSLPSWVDFKGRMLNIQRSPEHDNLSLRVRAVLDNGRSVNIPIEIDLNTGQVSERGKSSVSLSSFSDQLDTQVSGLSPENDALVKALADA